MLVCLCEDWQNWQRGISGIMIFKTGWSVGVRIMIHSSVFFILVIIMTTKSLQMSICKKKKKQEELWWGTWSTDRIIMTLINKIHDGFLPTHPDQQGGVLKVCSSCRGLWKREFSLRDRATHCGHRTLLWRKWACRGHTATKALLMETCCSCFKVVVFTLCDHNFCKTHCTLCFPYLIFTSIEASSFYMIFQII